MRQFTLGTRQDLTRGAATYDATGQTDYLDTFFDSEDAYTTLTVGAGTSSGGPLTLKILLFSVVIQGHVSIRNSSMPRDALVTR